MASPSNNGEAISSDPSPELVNIMSDEADDTQKPSNKETSPRTVDDDTDFWSTYVQAAEVSDKQLLETWNKNLDSLLTFAALFSAINTAFIIESYKELRPDPMNTTNTLLRSLLRHRNDDKPLSDTELGFITWDTPGSAIRINSTLFCSLACSLLASFGAVLGKEMLAEYSNAVALPAGAYAEQARARHRKFHGLDKFRFHLLMRLLPVLLQISLGVFLVGVIDFMWHSPATAAIIMIPAIIGLVGYLISLIIALLNEDSPFQTSLSISLRLIFRYHIMPLNVWRRRASGKGKDSGETQSYPHPPASTWKWLFQRARDIIDKSTDNPDSEAQLSENIHSQSNWMALCQIWADLCNYIPFWHQSEGSASYNSEALESINCVMWLLKQGRSNPHALRKVLKTFPLLPPDLLLEKQEKQNSMLEPYLSIYTSGLNRRPGDIEFRWDDPRKQQAIADAIIAGNALFHILKSREKGAPSFIKDLSFEVDPDLMEDIYQNARADLQLLTAILCVQTQKGVTEWTIVLLRRLLARHLKLITPQLPATAPAVPPSAASTLLSESSSGKTPSTTEVMPPAIALLLDVVIYTISDVHHEDQASSVYQLFPQHLERILQLLNSIFEEMSSSVALTSHVAIAMAAIQWYKKVHDRQSKLSNFNGVTLIEIRRAWLAVDKRVDLFNNVTMAFAMVKDEMKNQSDAMVLLYATLLRAIQNFMPRATGVSEKSESWQRWWSGVIPLIPTILQLVDRVRGDDRTTQLALHVIAQVLPDDRYTPKIQEDIDSKKINPELMLLSPLDLKYGVAVTRLISSVFSSQCMAQPTVRQAAAEVLGWTLLCPGVDKELPKLIQDAEKGKMYKQAPGIPSLIMSVWNSMYDLDKPNSTTVPVNNYFERYFTLLLKIDAKQYPDAETVQLQAVVMVLINSSRFSHRNVPPRANALTDLPNDSTVRALYELLRHIIPSDSALEQPTSFIPEEPGTSANWMPEQEIRRMGDEKFTEDDMNKIWWGDWLVTLWAIVSDRSIQPAKNLSYFFHEDAIDVVVNYLFAAINQTTGCTRLKISFRVTNQYMEKANTTENLSDEVKEKVEKAMGMMYRACSNGDTS